jgi:penicillin-binding protein 2
MRKDSDRYKQFTRRAALLAGGKAMVLTALLGRMYWLQVVESPRFAVLAEENRINPRLLPPPRGRILDRFGIPLADNRQNYRVVVVREQAKDIATTLARLASIVTLDDDTLKRILRETARTRAFVPVTVAEDLTWNQVSRIEVNSPDLPGVNIEVGEIRNYPFGPAAAHLLGYVASVSEAELDGEPLLELPGFRTGKIGVERVYDKTLRGAAGTSQVEVNAVGRVIRELSREEAKPGQEIVTTIDIGLQEYVQQRLALETSASAVVLDTVSGDVLALASSPAFDPNRFANGLSTAEWQMLVTDPLSPLTNKAIAGQYSPGSTFKMMVALAAMETGIEPSHRVVCTGQITLGNARFHCWKKEGHRSLDMLGAIKHSCDIYFYDLSRRVGIDRMADMARRFGLGRPVGLDLPGERAGLMPDRNWKLATLGEPWQGGETLVAGIGQGFTLATPLQLALMTARIANGRSAVVPRLARPASESAGAEAPAPPLGLAEDHVRLVQEGMVRVTNEPGGTAFSARIIEPGMAMAGKTGTSQVRRISLAERLAGVRKNEDLPWRQRDHALFVGFAPVGAPRYATAVVVEHGGGGSRVAAPIARDVLFEAQRRNSAGGPDRQVAGGDDPT